MLNVVLAILMLACLIAGVVILLFPFGKEMTAPTTKTAQSPYAHAIASLDALRVQGRQATATDVHIFVMWYSGFQGYRHDVPASVRYLHMLEWRARVDELYKELPDELVPMWCQLVHGQGHGGPFSQGFK